MAPRTELTLVALQPGRGGGADLEWTVTFRLTWAGRPHALAVAVRAADAKAAAALANEVIADRLIELAGAAARATRPALGPAGPRTFRAALAGACRAGSTEGPPDVPASSPSPAVGLSAAGEGDAEAAGSHRPRRSASRHRGRPVPPAALAGKRIAGPQAGSARFRFG